MLKYEDIVIIGLAIIMIICYIALIMRSIKESERHKPRTIKDSPVRGSLSKKVIRDAVRKVAAERGMQEVIAKEDGVDIHIKEFDVTQATMHMESDNPNMINATLVIDGKPTKRYVNFKTEIDLTTEKGKEIHSLITKVQTKLGYKIDREDKDADPVICKGFKKWLRLVVNKINEKSNADDKKNWWDRLSKEDKKTICEQGIGHVRHVITKDFKEGKETIEAMEDARAGNLVDVGTIEDLREDLNDDDEVDIHVIVKKFKEWDESVRGDKNADT